MEKPTKEELVAKLFEEFQSTCKHRGDFRPLAQEKIPDMVQKKIILVNTVICGNCGRAFIQSVMSPFNIGSIDPRIIR